MMAQAYPNRPVFEAPLEKRLRFRQPSRNRLAINSTTIFCGTHSVYAIETPGF